MNPASTEHTSLLAAEASIQHLRLNEMELQEEICASLQVLFNSGEWRGPKARNFSQYLVDRFGYGAVIATELSKQVGAVLTSDQLRDSNPEIQARIDSLLAWRRAEARERNIAAYRVLSNRTLLAIAREFPASVRELGKVHGIGQKKIENFGDKILEVLRPRARTYLDTDSMRNVLASTLY